jgi:hypothetical protein
LVKEFPFLASYPDAMQKLVHSLSCLLLALVLILSGPGATGAANGATMVVLCSGDTPATVWLDAQGNPVDPAAACYKCPHCLMSDAPPADTAGLRLILDALPVPVRLVLAVPPLPSPVAYLCPDPRGPPPPLSDSLRLGDQRPKARSLVRMVPTWLDHYQVSRRALAGVLRATLVRDA